MAKTVAAWIVLLCSGIAPAFAEEGMWTLDNFPAQKVEQTYGVEIGADWKRHVQRSVARIDGGCTGSFASPEGLVLTNNHCAWRCIRNLSSAELNLSEEGFLAADRADEVQCPGERISVLMGTEDVTQKVQRATAGKSDAAANEIRKQTLSDLESGCEDSSDGLSCESVALYNGGQYYLYKYQRYDDVRLVFAPELPIAAFGGDPDNFEFPRYCLDMTFLRVYENGRPAKTPHFFEWRPEGAQAAEPVFVVGHPGSTQRGLTVAQLQSQRSRSLPRQLLLMTEFRGALGQWGKTSAEAARIAQQRVLGLENGIKVLRNRIFSLLDDDLFERKRQQEQRFRTRVDQNPELRRLYGSAWSDMDAAIATYRAFSDRYYFAEGGAGFRSQLFGYAKTLVRAAEERAKKDLERLPEYRETALPRRERQLLAKVPVSSDYEKVSLAMSLEKMREWLGPDDPLVKKTLGKESPETLAARLIDGSRLAEVEERRRLWIGGSQEVDTSGDPLIALARKLDADLRGLRTRFEDEVEAPMVAASEKIARARFAVEGTDSYPDATFTLRVTYGSVKGWDEGGASVEPFTEVRTLFDRVTGEDPFRLPQSWTLNEGAIHPNTRFNFVADTDIIGGNSGSPVVDQNGDLVGLVFDGNIHSIAGAYWFDERKNRTVAVHPAVMLEAMEKIYGADVLLEELSLKKPAAAAAGGE